MPERVDLGPCRAIRHDQDRGRVAILTVVEIADADHAIQVPGEPLRSLEALRQVTDAVGLLAEQVGV
jgi:hypothetical protein